MKNSKFVLIHASTSVNFSILYKKPMIFISSTKYFKSYQRSIRFLSSQFDKFPINISKEIEINFDEEMRVDLNLYNDYIEKYIKEKETPEKSIWEIFIDSI